MDKERKIYFAGSIRGGRDDRELYGKLIEILGNYGEVLTEHIGDLSLTEYGERETSDEIYKRDVEWLDSADVMVAEVTTPSLGAGYEIGRAESQGKSILCLYREVEGKRLSAMISGNPNLMVREYGDLDEVGRIVGNFFVA